MATPIRFAFAKPSDPRGFTLVEMSVVLIIIGIIIVMVFPALTALRQSAQTSATANNQQTLLRAVAAFVQANGCLPCPTPASATGAGFGRVRGDTNTSACGTCSQPEGIVPFVSLGLSPSLARDGWGHWFTLRVDPALTNIIGVVPPTSLCLASDPQPCPLGTSQKGLCSKGLPTTKRITVQIRDSVNAAPTQIQAALLLLSHGPNGWGAYNATGQSTGSQNIHPDYYGTSGPCSALGGFERCNADGDASFVDSSFVSSGSESFDDIMVYLSRNALVAYLGNAGCQSEW